MESRKQNRKRNNCWKWMVGATTTVAAGTTASQAALVTISLNESIGSGYAGQLNADLTGDGHPDLSIVSGPYYAYRSRNAKLNGIQATFAWTDPSRSYHAGREQLGSRHASWVSIRHSTANGGSVANSYGTRTLTGSIPIFFKDLHINGGNPTEGWLQVTVFGGTIDASITLDSFSYNTPGSTPGTLSRVTAVPDHGSSLALLAMGATGILALRRWRTSQRQS